jgi:hypothetical protein
MPRKRRAPKLRQQISLEAVEAFRQDDWSALHFALGLQPWEVSPLDVYSAAPPDWVSNPQLSGWERAWALRQLLFSVELG